MRSNGRSTSFIMPAIMNSERPAEVTDRAVPVHWEADLIMGLDTSAIGGLVKRKTRLTMQVQRMAEHVVEVRIKNDPSLAGHRAEAVHASISGAITELPKQLRRSRT